jgi:hypothetical protein
MTTTITDTTTPDCDPGYDGKFDADTAGDIRCHELLDELAMEELDKRAADKLDNER